MAFEKIPQMMINPSGAQMLSNGPVQLDQCKMNCNANPLCGAIDYHDRMSLCRLFNREFSIVPTKNDDMTVYTKLGVGTPQAPTIPGTVPQPAVPTESSVLPIAMSPLNVHAHAFATQLARVRPFYLKQAYMVFKTSLHG